ncbi:Protein of unknown function [Roseovarius litoreus]|uniref:DUF2937 domain-containing protein n=1 Tax=Roseovarius litoreus TaxID=1155722 RepID=A0A1M7FAN3_9RHOB|nr:DUF2937 family protein [Roseovarius litoreus]SHM01076.1 Protein of unknown function [Roseovarius litoreus]
MILRAIAMACGLTGAVGLSQFPEFSQQYTQRLSGAVKELETIVARFDADAAGLGLTRAAALEDLAQGSAMGAARAQSMGQVLARHDRLQHALAKLSGTSSLHKALNIRGFADAELVRDTWAAYRPALPVTAEGLGFAAAGFILGYGLIGGALSGLGRLTSRRRQAARQG